MINIYGKKKRIFNPKDEILARAIMKSVSAKFEINQSDLIRNAKSRKKEHSYIRSWVWFFAREFRFTSSSIARYFGKDHSSVVVAHQRVRSFIDVYEQEKKTYSEILHKIAQTSSVLTDRKHDAVSDLVKGKEIYRPN